MSGELTLSAGGPPKKMTPSQRQRMRLVMAAFNAGVKVLKAARARRCIGNAGRNDGRWWPELAPLRVHERKLVWTYLGQHFGIPETKENMNANAAQKGRGEANHDGLQFQPEG